MKRLLKLILISASILSLAVSAYAQPIGATQSNPIDAGSFGTTGGTYTDTKNNAPANGYGHEIGTDAHDIFYRFTLTADAAYTISTCGSSQWTRITLLNSAGEIICIEQGAGPVCPTTFRASLKGQLYAGTYYIASETFWGTTGNVVTTLTIDPSPGGTGNASTLSGSQNYVATYLPRVGITSAASLNGKAVAEVNQTVQYFDGLGRPMQTVQTFASPDKRDIVQPVEYDAYGREANKYLPYAEGSSWGTYRSTAITSQKSFYNSGSTYGVLTIPSAGGQTPSFAETKFEPSPLNRVIEQGSPGDAWQLSSGHTVKMEYGSNASSEGPLWTMNSTDNGAATNGLYYGANQLYKTVLKDENWVSGQAGTTEEFKDKEGRVVLKRTFNHNVVSNVLEILSTYYVYDDLGNLRYVIPPAVSATSFTEATTDDPFNQFIYAYHYDHRNRLVEKKIPGKGWEHLIYNKLDQVIATQDVNQRNQNQWLFTKYDAFGRTVLTGLYTNGSGRVAVQAIADGISTYWETRSGSTYSNSAFPTSGTNLTVNYYDDYSFSPLYAFATYTYDVNLQPTTRTKGLLTGSLVNILGTSTYLQSVNYYNEDARLIQSHVQHHLSGSDRTDNKYSFTGELTDSKRIHSSSGGSVNITNKYVYDHVGRKKQTLQSTGTGNEVELSELEYNEIGQLKKKDLHNNLQSTTYTYNARGWLKSSISDQFSMALNYEDGTNPQYNGNISNQHWGASAPNLHTFTYQYDKLNRLISSVSTTGLNETGPSSSGYIEYDLMGNIKKLNRANTPAGNTAFIYTYEGNRLKNVDGLASADYQYDGNGNATYDAKNGINLTYNMLNLPQTAGVLTYTYDVTGSKLTKHNSTTSVTREYIKGIEYENGLIDIIHTEEGIARRSGTEYTYEYSLEDHLGNVRYSFKQDPNTLLLDRIQSDDYYAFGMRKSGSPVSEVNKYLYNGKELQDELGQYDYGARFYDPVIGRWNVIDAKAELYFQITPYAYAANTPTNAIDPNGHLVIFVNGNYTDGSGGSRKYWQSRHTEKVKGEDSFRSVVDLDFAGAVMNRLGDHNARYVDGGGNFFKGNHPFMSLLFPGLSGIGAYDRKSAGYAQGKNEAADVIESLHRTNGVIDESIKVIAHSMGAAYAKGYIKAVMDYAKQHNIAGVNVAFEADYAPFQPKQQKAVKGVPTLQFSHDEQVAGDAPIPGAIQMDTSQDKKQEHSIFSFMNQINSLPTGKYKVVDGEIVLE